MSTRHLKQEIPQIRADEKGLGLYDVPPLPATESALHSSMLMGTFARYEIAFTFARDSVVFDAD